MNGRARPSLKARISPSRTPSSRAAGRPRRSPGTGRSRLEVARVQPDVRRACGAGRGCRRTCPRPRPPGRGGVMISAASSAGDASMNLSGWNSASSASPSRSSRASSASRPTSPVSIPAHLTSSSGRSNAFAIAASTRPSRSPMRSSPPSTLTMALAVCGSARSRSSLSSRALAAGPEAASIAANVAATSGSVGLTSGGGAWPAADQDVLDGQAQGRSSGRTPRRGPPRVPPATSRDRRR